MKVLFLCTANICRSPVAEHYLRQLTQKLGSMRLEIYSAGIRDYVGYPADPVVARLARERGMDLSRHRSRGTSAQELEDVDQIVVMERRHRAWLREHYAPVLPKVVLLREMVDGHKGDIPDPTGADEGHYRRALDMLFRGVEHLALSFRYPP
jgi:protein-tyrosine-phosphatase